MSFELIQVKNHIKKSRSHYRTENDNNGQMPAVAAAPGAIPGVYPTGAAMAVANPTAGAIPVIYPTPGSPPVAPAPSPASPSGSRA